ncbi:MAG: elongation factor G [Deltaproteobacteria bacterium]|nr:elongation factor G [Deltaproteobacteria bacterium]
MTIKAASYRPEDIRNVVLLGHGGAGKTTLAEAILHRCGAITRMGSVDDENTTSDFEPEARSHHYSTNSSLLFATYKGREINLIDTPGHPELIGMTLSALPAVETAIIVVNAMNGIEFNTRRLFHAAGEAGLARMIVVNKIDQKPGGLAAVLSELVSAFGPRVHCMNLPTKNGTDVIDCFDQEAGDADFGSVADVHREMLESTVEADDEALEKYLAGEALDVPALRRAFIKAMVAGQVVPVLFASAKSEVGVDDLLHILAEEAPSPVSGRARRLRKGDASVAEIPCDPDKPLLAHCFKVTSDPQLGRMAMIRVLQGKIDGSTSFVVNADKKKIKAGHVLKIEGRDHPELEAVAFAGDIIALGRIEDLHADTILHTPDAGDDLRAVRPAYPKPMLSLAMESKSRNDDAKLGVALGALSEEDPTFNFAHDDTTHELIVNGIGDVHLGVMLERLANRYRLEVKTKPPTIAYKETITGRAEGHHRHKKQTGGAGQFGEVYLRIEPLQRGEGFQFASEVVGGAIPTHFIPAVEKGVMDAMAAGVVAGYPVQDVRVVVYDGKTHAVDGKEVAFRTAGKIATREAMAKARPALLEPIVSLEITAPEQYMGAVTADLKQCRARVFGIDTLPGGISSVRAQAPLGELGDFGGRLRGSTGGHGTFVMEPAAYDFVPKPQEQKIIADRASKLAAQKTEDD